MADAKNTQTLGQDAGATGGPTVKIGDKEFSQSQIEEWEKKYGDDTGWKRENERRSTELKQEKREFEELQEERQTEIDSLKEEMETLKTQLATPSEVGEFPDFSLLPPEEQVKYMRALAKEEAESLRIEIRKKEQEREQAEAKKEKERWKEDSLKYHLGLETKFREKYKEEFGGSGNDAKFDAFAQRTLQRFGLKNGQLPSGALEDQLRLEQDPEELKKQLSQKIREDLTGKHSTFTTIPLPATVQPLEEGYEKKTLGQILEEDREKGNLPDMSEV